MNSLKGYAKNLNKDHKTLSDLRTSSHKYPISGVEKYKYF